MSKGFFVNNEGNAVYFGTRSDKPELEANHTWVDSNDPSAGDLWATFDIQPPLSMRDRRAARYASELSNGNASRTEALADTMSAIITEVADLRQRGIDLVDDLRQHNIPVNPNLFGEMTTNLAERIEKIEIIQAEEV